MERVKRVDKNPVPREEMDTWLTAFQYKKLFVDFIAGIATDPVISTSRGNTGTMAI